MHEFTLKVYKKCTLPGQRDWLSTSDFLFLSPFVHLDISLSYKYTVGLLWMDGCSPSLNGSVSVWDSSLRRPLTYEASQMTHSSYASFRKI